jgi:hypothetical protein
MVILFGAVLVLATLTTIAQFVVGIMVVFAARKAERTQSAR